MNARRWHWLLPLLFFSTLVHAQAPPSLSVGTEADLPFLDLTTLLEEVASSNPTLQAAFLEREALQTRKAQVATLPDPRVMATYQPFPLMTARGAQRSQWRVEQPLPYPGKLRLQGEIADLSAEIAGWEAHTLEQDLVLTVKQAYYDLYRIQEQEALIHTFQEQLETFEQVALTQYEVGTGMQQAILKAQVEKNTLHQRLLSLSTQRRSALESLALAVNRPITGPVVVRVTMPDEPLVSEAALVVLAEEYRPEAEALRVAQTRANQSIALAQKQFLPDFGFNLTYFDLASSDLMPTATGRDALAVGVSIQVPLQRDRLQAHLRESRLRALQVQARQEALRQNFTTQIADMTNRLRQEAEQLDLFEATLIPQAETTLQATLSAYTTGRTDFLNLLDAERMLFTLRMSTEESRSRYLMASARLERTLGLPDLADVPTALPQENR